MRVAQPAVANFVYVDTETDVGPLFDSLLHEGVIVRPLGAFGATTAIRVTVGTAEENAFFGEAFARVLAAAV